MRKYRYLIVAGLTIPCTAASAAPVATGHMGAAARGEPVQQHFLAAAPQGNLSIVTTRQGRACVASRRIEIETSDYRAPTGEPVPFDQIIRSPATSIQAVAGPEGAPGFRIQLKYSLAPGAPAALIIGGQEHDVAGALEPSGDSLWLTGATADALAAAFRDGAAATVTARSRDTGRQVSDRLPAPDLAALADCAAGLGSAPAAAMPVTGEIRLSFDAEQSDDRIATPEDMRACGMKDQPGTLYLGRLRDVSGFVSHTDRVFVAYAPEGAVSRVYVPGIFDADLTGRQSSARLSHAADGNVPTAANRVTGCLGDHAVEICHYPGEGGLHHLGPCLGLPGMPPADGTPYAGGTVPRAPLPGLPVVLPPGGFGPGNPGTGTTTPPPVASLIPPVNGNGNTPYTALMIPPVSGSGEENPGVGPNPGDTDDPVTPIPLPLPGLMLGGALLLLAGLRRRMRG